MATVELNGVDVSVDPALRSSDHDGLVVFIDADEEVSPALRDEIKQEFEEGKQAGCAGYEFPRLVYYLGRWIRHGGWYPDLLMDAESIPHVPGDRFANLWVKVRVPPEAQPGTYQGAITVTAERPSGIPRSTLSGAQGEFPSSSATQ